MRWRVAVIALWLIVASGAPLARAEEAGSGPASSFSFVQMADPQFGFFATPMWLAIRGYNFWNAGSFERESELYERAIADANRLDPAFVVICGDLVNQPGNAEQLAEFQRISRGLRQDIPLYLAAGNHDVENTPTPESLAWYRREIGPDWYSFRHGRMAGIVLNSALIVAPEKVLAEEQAQWDWLVGELARLGADGAEPVLVFQHHSYFLEQADEEDAYFNVPLERRTRYLELLRDNGVRAVFAGHLHRNGHGSFGSLEMVTSGPVGRPLGDDPSGLRVVSVDGAEIAHHYYALDAQP